MIIKSYIKKQTIKKLGQIFVLLIFCLCSISACTASFQTKGDIAIGAGIGSSIKK